MRWLQSMLRRLRPEHNPTKHWVQRLGIATEIDIDNGSLDDVGLGASIEGLSHLGAGETMPDGCTLFFPSHGIWIEDDLGRLSSIRVSLAAPVEGAGSHIFHAVIRWRGRTLRTADLRTVSDVQSIGGAECASDCDRDETVLTYVAGVHLIEFELNHAGVGSMLTISNRHCKQ